MKQIPAFTALFSILAGCTQQSPAEPVAVASIIENIHAWDGEIVTVIGWLGKCEALDCGIYPTLADAKIAAMASHKKDEWSAAMDRRISIGSDDQFDRAAIQMQFKKVSIRAKVSDQCRGWMVGCTDRAPDLHPISITLNSPDKDI